ncbi:MAG: hypothetical protein KDA69_19270 [Planctomycetaceae bacterium]|nr:hypothetical protein [Planctomycetaceae bacterium]MCA9046476.1 hypothetical protein [Planctomycetaceae bacterium]
MNIKRGFQIIGLTAVAFAVIGGLLGYLIGTYVPGYYETVFTLPEDVNIVTLGTVLGMTQGLVAGLVLGAIVVVCTTWYEVSKLNWRDEDEAGTA